MFWRRKEGQSDESEWTEEVQEYVERKRLTKKERDTEE